MQIIKILCGNGQIFFAETSSNSLLSSLAGEEVRGRYLNTCFTNDQRWVSDCHFFKYSQIDLKFIHLIQIKLLILPTENCVYRKNSLWNKNNSDAFHHLSLHILISFNILRIIWNWCTLIRFNANHFQQKMDKSKDKCFLVHISPLLPYNYKSVAISNQKYKHLHYFSLEPFLLHKGQNWVISLVASSW